MTTLTATARRLEGSPRRRRNEGLVRALLLAASIVSAVGATHVPLASFEIWISATLSLFSSANAKPTQPSEVGAPAIPSMIALSLAEAV
jgi:hypothetical protein